MKSRTLQLSLLLCIIYCFLAIRVTEKADNFDRIIRTDAVGYYTWLPAVLKFQDPDFRFCDTVYESSGAFSKGYFKGIIVQVGENQTMNKYPPGCAIVSIPFYSIAYLVGILKEETNGYERHFQIAWLLSAMFWVCIGIFFLFRIAGINSGNNTLSFLLISGVVFGTNLFQYTTFDIGYSHAFTFGALSGLIFFLTRSSNLDWVYASVFAGIVFLIRPFNIVFLPVALFFTMNYWWEDLQQSPQKVMKPALVFIAFIGLYLLSNYWQTGEAFIYSYGNERFDFSKPHFFDFLFGYKVGAFIYSPLSLIYLVAGSLLLMVKRNWLLLSVLIFSFFGISWILSCWSDWTFGCTLGCRPLVDFMPFLLFPLLTAGFTLHWKSFGPSLMIIGLGIWYNQILHYQYRIGILNWCNMDKEKFWDVFLKTNSDYAFYTSGDWDFSKKKNNVFLDTFSADTTHFKFDHYGYNASLLTIDSIRTTTRRQLRIKMTCEAKFHANRGENMMSVYINTMDGVYHDYMNKFVKKM